ncbi:hypothetical protein HanIR_Chr06g0265181 [Helianthus annuus]|nr:hypothetical protein HanIR_Chr06g0265181 [Helianthus annuus]
MMMMFLVIKKKKKKKPSDLDKRADSDFRKQKLPKRTYFFRYTYSSDQVIQSNTYEISEIIFLIAESGLYISRHL